MSVQDFLIALRARLGAGYEVTHTYTSKHTVYLIVSGEQGLYIELNRERWLTQEFTAFQAISKLAAQLSA